MSIYKLRRKLSLATKVKLEAVRTLFFCLSGSVRNGLRKRGFGREAVRALGCVSACRVQHSALSYSRLDTQRFFDFLLLFVIVRNRA